MRTLLWRIQLHNWRRFDGALAALIALGCSDVPERAAKLPVAIAATRVVEVDSALSLATPLGRVGSDSSILIADATDGRVIHLGVDGKVHWSYQRRGTSPGLLRYPIGLYKSPGRYWIADAANGVFAIDSATKSLACVANQKSGIVGDAASLGDSLLVVVGPRTAVDGKTTWLSVIDMRSCRIRWSALEINVGADQRTVNSYGRAQVSRFGETIAVIVSTLDTLYTLNMRSGRVISRRPLFLPLYVPAAITSASTRPSARELGKMVRLSGLLLTSDSTSIIQITKGRQQEATSRWFRAGLQAGSRVYEVEPSAFLLGGDDAVSLATTSIANPSRKLLVVRF